VVPSVAHPASVALFVHLVFGPRDDATLIRRRQLSSSTVQPFWKGARTSVGPSECTGGSPSRFYSPDDADGRRRGVGGPGSMDRTLASWLIEESTPGRNDERLYVVTIRRTFA
jgi:hypothetical protein